MRCRRRCKSAGRRATWLHNSAHVAARAPHRRAGRSQRERPVAASRARRRCRASSKSSVNSACQLRLSWQLVAMTAAWLRHRGRRRADATAGWQVSGSGAQRAAIKPSTQCGSSAFMTELCLRSGAVSAILQGFGWWLQGFWFIDDALSASLPVSRHQRFSSTDGGCIAVEFAQQAVFASVTIVAPQCSGRVSAACCLGLCRAQLFQGQHVRTATAGPPELVSGGYGHSCRLRHAASDMDRAALGRVVRICWRQWTLWDNNLAANTL